MTRPTWIHISRSALLHNLACIKTWAMGRRIAAMVKANAYGCGLSVVVPALMGRVDAFGVGCLEEAFAVRALAPEAPCILMEGFFTAEELPLIDKAHFQIVLHQSYQLQALLQTPLISPLKVWIKLDTGMHRLGFKPDELQHVISALQACPWVSPAIGVLSHFASADVPDCETNEQQLAVFNHTLQDISDGGLSFCNSAACLRIPQVRGNVVRPGIMLYGISPFAGQIGASLGLKPVMRLSAGIISIKEYPVGSKIGYGGVWETKRPSEIAIVACGYGDGYPRHIVENTPVMVNNQKVPIVGRVSMDMLAIDVTDLKEKPKIGDEVELWGEHIPVEHIAESAGTIAYELICQVTQRPCRTYDI